MHGIYVNSFKVYRGKPTFLNKVLCVKRLSVYKVHTRIKVKFQVTLNITLIYINLFYFSYVFWSSHLSSSFLSKDNLQKEILLWLYSLRRSLYSSKMTTLTLITIFLLILYYLFIKFSPVLISQPYTWRNWPLKSIRVIFNFFFLRPLGIWIKLVTVNPISLKITNVPLSLFFSVFKFKSNVKLFKISMKLKKGDGEVSFVM